MRQKIGLKPVNQEGADELRNRNISESKEEIEAKYAKGKIKMDKGGETDE
jgi:hypothetical protein